MSLKPSQQLKVEYVDINSLIPHSNNYRVHTEDQLDHIKASVQKNGIYRNIIIARGNIILAGHGVVEACKQLGMETVPVVRIDIDPNSVQAKKILIGDNEISNLGQVDDRLLSEILLEIKEIDVGELLGTGFDELQLANLIYVTRPASEIADFNEAREWTGLPEYDEEMDPSLRDYLIEIRFKSKKDREKFVKEKDIEIKVRKSEHRWITEWPKLQKDHKSSIKFE